MAVGDVAAIGVLLRAGATTGAGVVIALVIGLAVVVAASPPARSRGSAGTRPTWWPTGASMARFVSDRQKYIYIMLASLETRFQR